MNALDVAVAVNAGATQGERVAFGTVNDDVLALRDPRFQRTDFCKVILGSAWAS